MILERRGRIIQGGKKNIGGERTFKGMEFLSMFGRKRKEDLNNTTIRGRK